MSARWKPMDIVYSDRLMRSRCLILSVHESGRGVSYEAISESDGFPDLPECAAMTHDEWMQWLLKFSDDLRGREMRECRDAANAPLVEPESWAGFRRRYAETGDPWIQ